MISFGFGKEGDPAGTVEHLYDKDPEYPLTGLTDGFVHYQDVLKKRYKDFELGGSKTFSVNNATVIYYAFSTPHWKGKESIRSMPITHRGRTCGGAHLLRKV